VATRRALPALLAELSRLSADPLAQARLACEILAAERRPQLVGPALAALEETPVPEARPALLSLYADLDADGVRHDAGGTFRAAALRSLRPWATVDELPLLERAVTTYEFLPPGRSEEATPIRAAGLVAMADLDPELAGFHAARLLADVEHTSRLSGEPAKTAVGVLAARSELLALYHCVLGGRQVEDAIAECLRHLAAAPDSIVGALFERFGADASETVQLGVIDMLLARPERPLFHQELRARLQARAGLAVTRYLAVTMVASRRAELVAEVLAAVRGERDARRLEALAEGLALLPGDPEAWRALEEARARVGRR
jgi:hypothetical protein